MAHEERDYSHRSLVDKLGVKPGQRLCARGSFDAAFIASVEAGAGNAVASAARGRYDIVFLRVDGPADLRAIAALAKRLEPAGGLWIVHPKGKGATPTEHEVRAAGIAAGLVDNKVCAFNDSHTATRYVIPKGKR